MYYRIKNRRQTIFLLSFGANSNVMKSSLCWPDVSSEHSWFFGVYKPRPINMLYMLHFTCYFCPSQMEKNGIFPLAGHFLSAERLSVCFGQCGFSKSLIIRLWTSKRKKANRKGRSFFHDCLIPATNLSIIWMWWFFGNFNIDLFWLNANKVAMSIQ